MKNKITHLTSAHLRYDTRIFLKECSSLSKIENYKVSLIVADGFGDEEKNGVDIIEAMSCCLPGVATKCGGPESILIDEKLGELVDIDIDSMAVGMKKVYQDNYSQKYMRNYVIENFSEDVIVKKIIRIYNEVLK